MKTKAKYVIVILFLCTIPLYFCRMIGWKDDAIRLYDVILYGMESQEGDSFVGGMIWKLMQESVFENINAWLIGTAAVTLVGSVLVTLLCSGNCIIHRDKRRSCVVNATTQLGMEKQG
jgi:hypothetical protein